MKKRIILTWVAVLCMAVMGGCGRTDGGNAAAGNTKNLEGSCAEILEKTYATAALDEGLRDAMEYYQTTAIDDETEEYILGTTEIDYTDSVYSAPMMSSVAYQCVVLRIDEHEDVQEAKQLLLDNANPAKWVCVEAENVAVENVGDVVLFIMADEQTVTAVREAFLALGEE